jgi:hypothetical protein
MENLPNGIRSFAWAAIWSLQRTGNDIMPQIFFGKGLARLVCRSLQAFACIGSRMEIRRQGSPYLLVKLSPG